MFGSLSLVVGTVAETLLFRKDALAFTAAVNASSSYQASLAHHLYTTEGGLPRTPREVFHVLHPRAPREVIHALRERPSTRSEGGGR